MKKDGNTDQTLYLSRAKNAIVTLGALAMLAAGSACGPRVLIKGPAPAPYDDMIALRSGDTVTYKLSEKGRTVRELVDEDITDRLAFGQDPEDMLVDKQGNKTFTCQQNEYIVDNGVPVYGSVPAGTTDAQLRQIARIGVAPKVTPAPAKKKVKPVKSGQKMSLAERLKAQRGSAPVPVETKATPSGTVNVSDIDEFTAAHQLRCRSAMYDAARQLKSIKQHGVTQIGKERGYDFK